MDKNLPANTGDTGLIPGLGRVHMPQNNWAPAQLESLSHNYWAYMLQLLKSAHPKARMLELLSPCAAAIEDHVPTPCAPRQKKPPQWETHALKLESSHRSLQLEKAHA